MMKIELLQVKYHDQLVGTLSLTPDNKLCVFEYAPSWLADGFSISPLELPLRPGLFLAKPSPFFGNFGIFEDSQKPSSRMKKDIGWSSSDIPTTRKTWDSRSITTMKWQDSAALM